MCYLRHCDKIKLDVVFLVNVVDTNPPVISGCPQSATYTVPLGTLGTIARWTEPTAIDDSGVVPTSIQSHQSGDNFMVGVTQVTYIFSDQANNQATCEFTITGKYVTTIQASCCVPCKNLQKASFAIFLQQYKVTKVRELLHIGKRKYLNLECFLKSL